ncbi:clavesin-2-like isoform X2 [Euwallacea fornicatus]|uniref:clavesin-2-like isoform X2 n=1 Tax=Euwallacea fornicatus TaxID=995702 RepID=UPI00338FF0E2
MSSSEKMVEELCLDEDEKKRRVDELKRMIQDDKILSRFPFTDEVYLDRFLGGTSFVVEEAFARLKTYYELLSEFPEWFTTDPPMAKKHLIEKEIRAVLSETDREGRPIYLVKLGNCCRNSFFKANCNPSKMELLEIVAVDDIWIESILLNSPSEKGLCVLVDIANFHLKSVKWLTPHNIKTAVKKIQCLPFKDYRFHVVNNHMMVKPVVKILWPFLPDSIKDIKFHFDDRDSLHEFIDPHILPPEYGGRNSDIDYKGIFRQLFEQNERIFESFRLYRQLQLV